MELKPCGTEAAYRRHLRNKDPRCEKCLKANARAHDLRRPACQHPSGCSTTAVYDGLCSRHCREVHGMVAYRNYCKVCKSKIVQYHGLCSGCFRVTFGMTVYVYKKNKVG